MFQLHMLFFIFFLLIKIFWSFAIQKFLWRHSFAQRLPDSSDALAPAILWTSISQMVQHTARMIFCWAMFISDLGRERANQTGSVASISAVAWEWKGGVNLKPLYGERNKAITIYLSDGCTHFTLRFFLSRNRHIEDSNHFFSSWHLWWLIWGIYIM